MSDAYNYIPSFFSEDQKGGALTYEQLQARRKIAAALATRNRPFPKTVGEGLTYFGESLGEMMGDRRAAAGEAAYRRQTNADIDRLSRPEAAPQAAPPTVAPPAAPGPMSPDIDPFGGGFRGAAADISGTEQALAPSNLPAVPRAEPTKLASTQAMAFAPGSQSDEMPIEEWKARVARIESGGRRDPYSAIGPVSRRGDHAYGKYQVMGENIPKWTKEHLGREMTPKEFLVDKDAQEAVATGQGSKYIAKFGPQDAAAAWFAGPNGFNDPNRKDQLGTHVAEYRRRFNLPLVTRDQIAGSLTAQAPSAPAFAPADVGGGEPAPVRLASLGGMPTPDTAPDPRAAIAGTLAPPPPQPEPQQAAQVIQPSAPRQQAPIGTPVPSTVTGPPTGPPKAPDPEPMTQREMEIRRRIGSTSDPYVKGQLEPIADRLAEERKFRDVQKMKAWEKEDAAWIKRTDPAQRAQLEKLQREEADATRERMKTEARGGVSQAVIDKKIEDSAKTAGPLREASTAINQVEELLNRGMFTGLTGELELRIAKAKMAMGGAADPRIAATEQFTSSIKPIVAAARAALAGGANISDRDMMAAEAASGGNITLTEQGIRDIMKSLRVIQMQSAQHHQRVLSTAAGGDTAAENVLYGLHGLPMENIIPRSHPTVERLMQNADNEHERGLFNKAWHTPGLAEKIITRNRAR